METNIYLPKAPKLVKQISQNHAVFEIEELYPGFGLTIGNALRRVMLSSLPGAAIVSVKIKDVSHEFSTIPGVIEDVVEIILNLKQIRFKIHSIEPQTVTLKVKGEREATGKDIKLSSQVEIMNPNAHIATLSLKNASLEMEMKIEKGLGYSGVESRESKKQEIGGIAVDAIFTPIRMINYKVEDMRVGDKTNYNRLIFDIETDGTITPQQALVDASNILIDHYKIIASGVTKAKSEEREMEQENIKKESKKEETDVLKTKVEDLKLSNRTQNILIDNHLKNVGGIVKMSEQDLMELEGLGDKAIKEIKKTLGKLGLTLKQDS